MARSDAVGKEPTIEELNTAHMATFRGVTTTDGEVSDGGATPEEVEARAARAAQEAPAVKVAGDSEVEDDTATETPEDKAAREAAEAKLTDKQKAAKALQAKIGGKDAKHRSANDRIGQAVAKQRATERELQSERDARQRDRGEFEARLAALEKRPLTPDDKSATVVDKDAPQPASYEYGELDAAYIRDLARYETRKELAADRTKQAVASQTEVQRREAQEFQAKADTFAAAGEEKFDDFAEVVIQGARDKTWPLTKDFGDLMFDSDVGPDIAYYLATHPDEAVKIMQQTPAGQARAFGRLEATFSSTSQDAAELDDEPSAETARPAPKPAPASVTKAPQPPHTRVRAAGGKTQVTAATTDFAAFERLAQGGG